MDEIQLHPSIVPVLIALFLLSCLTKWLSKPVGKKSLPPAPTKLPVLGNLHQLGSLLHRNLHSLAQTHGPLMLLHFGSVPVLIVSSADAAREIMRTHDLAFADRPVYKAFKKLLYDCKDVATAPYGEYLRKVKGIFVLQLLSNKRVQSFRSIREDETALMVKKIKESSGLVNLTKMFADFANDGICRAAFGWNYSESENGKKFISLLAEFTGLLGAINIGDFIPWLRWIARVNGFNKRVDKTAKAMDDILESVIKERVKTPIGQAAVLEKKGENFLDILLESYNVDNRADVLSVARDNIKALILAGAEAEKGAKSTLIRKLILIDDEGVQIGANINCINTMANT